MPSRALLPVLTCALAAALAGCIAPPPMPPSYKPPQPGMVITYSQTADAKTPTVRHRIVRNADDRIVNIVTSLPSGRERENRTLRGVVTYQVWQKGEGVIVEDIRKNPVRDLWPLAPHNWSVTEGPIYIGQGATRQAALKNVKRTGSIWQSYQILRRENIKVPAGTFDTVVIKRVAVVKKADGTVDLRSEKTYWYAPSLGWIVRLDTVNKRPGAPDRKSRMVAISINRPAAAR